MMAAMVVRESTTRDARPGPPVRLAAPRRPRLPGVAALLSLIVVAILWVANDGLTELAAPATALTAIGRLTGLLAADLLLIQVLLMARVPWIERAWGQDQLARWHRLVGFTSINL